MFNHCDSLLFYFTFRMCAKTNRRPECCPQKAFQDKYQFKTGAEAGGMRESHPQVQRAQQLFLAENKKHCAQLDYY